MTIRLPDDKHNRLKGLAERRKISLNKLIEELATVALAEHDAFARFHLRASRGDPERALQLLDRLDQYDTPVR